MFKYLGSFLLGCFVTLSHAQSISTYIPPKAIQYLPIVKQEVISLMPDFEYPHYFGALIEHESCISLKHSRCWSPTSRLSTAREEGAGFFQLTRAYQPDGSIRFDVIEDLKKRYRYELKELSWKNVYLKPELQIRAGILLSRQNYQALYPVKESWQRLAMADSAYNGGLKHVNAARRTCNLSARCDAQIWFNNVELYLPKSRKPLYAGRSALEINQHHVKDVLKTRMPKYKPYF